MFLQNATWTRYNKDTKALEWEFKAETAKPIGKEWTCTKPTLRTFKLIVKNGKNELLQDLALKSDTCQYFKDEENAKAKLVGNVIIDILSNDPTRFTTDKADIMTNDNELKGGRRIETASPVTIASQKRTIKGVGFVAEEKAAKDTSKKAESWMLIEKDVTMTLEGETAGMPSIGIDKPQPGEAKDQKTTVTCDGPAKIDRAKGAIDFQNNVVVLREGTEMRSKDLKLDYAETQKNGKSETEITKMLAGGGVTIVTKDSQQNEQQFFGDTFEWDQKTSSGKLTGRPAKTIAGDSTVIAPVVEFDQASDKIKYTGGASAELKMKFKQ